MLSNELSEALSVALELNDQPDGEEKLVGAITTAAENADQALEAQARAALGIFYLHHGIPGDAKAHLEKALQQLDPSDPDYHSAKDHLDALNNGDACGCLGENAKVAKLIRDYVMRRLPKDLISRFGVRVGNSGGVKLDVEVTRALSDSEASLVNKTIDEALKMFTLRLGKH